MSTIVKKVIIPENRRMNLDINVPENLPAGEAVITVTIECGGADEKRRNRLDELFGKGKGEVWMADDFDAPLADFKDYM